ncbi:PAS domain-containing protein, partial [Escherichia coli]|uniref:PAS domain-containing protein n=1 Tax=Escherichia coli TaxID=562 RepID=UPI003D9C1AED
MDRYLVDLKGLVDATLDGLAVVRDGRIVELNTRFAGLLGRDETSLVGKNPDELFRATDGQPVYIPRNAPVEAIRERADRAQ